ncbi:MAG: HAD-IB family phosphatase [Candidatus Baldrarchaeia archaeon]
MLAQAKKYRAIVFDLDGTLVKEESSWATVHRYFGVDPRKIRKNMEAYLSGRIDYCEWMRRDISLWLETKHPIHLSEIEKCLSKYTLVRGAKEVSRELKKRGYVLAIVTSGLDILAHRVARDLGIDYVFANGLAVDEKGFLTGEPICKVPLLNKNVAIKDLCGILNAKFEEIIAVGDTKFDISMFKCAGLSIALNPKDEEVVQFADIVIRCEDMRSLLNYIS